MKVKSQQQHSQSQTSPQLLERTFAVLSLFTPEKPQWTTTEIGRACDVPVPTVHRILAALHRHGFVARDELSKRFRLGPAALALGRNAQASTDIRALSAPVLQQLASQIRETTLLTVISDGRDRAVCLERVESPQPLRLSVEPGRALPLHAGASQKVLLAYMPEAEAERIINGKLEKLCKSTIVDPDQLRDELATIRARGWASSSEETNIGAWGVAVALLDEDDCAVAALGLAGPRARVPRPQIKMWLTALKIASENLARMAALRPSLPQARSASTKDKPVTEKEGVR